MQWRLNMLSRNKPSAKPDERPSVRVDQPDGEGLKAPVVRSKLEVMVAALSELESEMAALALAAAEGKPDAAAIAGAGRSR